MTRRLLPVARLGDLLTSDRGLTAAEVGERRARYGLNDILETPPNRWRDLARDTVKDPMLWFLAGVSGLYAGVGELKEAVILLVAIVPLIGMDAFLHWRTQASTEGLKSRLAERASVVRDSVPAQIPARELVPGDLALVASAEAFPADGIIVGGAELQVDESSLTGEAYPVAKRPPTGAFGRGEEPLVDVQHWGFAGTRLLTGRVTLRVIFTGAETLYGEIVHSAVHGPHDRTPLQAAIQNLVAVLLGAAAAICVILAAVRIFQGHGWLDALLSAVTLAAAAVPEEFPVVFTFFLGVGVYRLARRQALVRRAVAVENIGRITAICSDKTGTITEGRLRLTHLVPAEGVEEQDLLHLGALASRSDSGDPIDEAIARASRRHCRPRSWRRDAGEVPVHRGPQARNRDRPPEHRCHDGGHQGCRRDDLRDVGTHELRPRDLGGARRAPDRGRAQGDCFRVAVGRRGHSDRGGARTWLSASPGCWPSKTR